MKITKVRVIPVSIPSEPPVGLGEVALNSTDFVVTYLETDEGLVGEGLAFSINGKGLSAVAKLTQELEPLVLGLDHRYPRRFTIEAAKARKSNPENVAAQALAGVECAIMDLRAKAAGLNVSQLLGSCRATIPVYHSGALWVSLSNDALFESAKREVDRGFRALKTRLIGDPDKDVPRVRGIREAVGPDVRLMADSNQKMDAKTSIEMGRRLEEFDLFWFEEPVPATDHAGEKQVSEQQNIPLALGESVFFASGVKALIERGAASVIMPDLQRMGGPLEFLKASVIAEEAGIPFSSHLFTEMSISLLASVPGACILEYMPWMTKLYSTGIELDAHGYAIVPDQPGWGYSFDSDIVKRYAI